VSSKPHIKDKIVENYKVGWGYKTIFKALWVSWIFVQAIVLKWKDYDTTGLLRVRRASIRKAAKRHMVNLEDLQRSTTQLGKSVNREAIRSAVHKTGL
uniref:Transposase Tc1-like domain-containing protein n=1 Tax=Xiphophorus maculatus TaxID=8083 RepID=A0A3B5QXA2_XIPMA